MLKEQIGKVMLYLEDESSRSSAPAPQKQEMEETYQKLQEIIMQSKEEDYHRRITEHKSYEVMYQLAESRGHIVQWLDIPQQAKVLELGAGCGAITSILLQKGAAVTCQESDVSYARLNAWRHKDRERLSIYAMPFETCAAQLPGDFDLVIAVGILAHADPMQLMCCLREQLKPDGLLVLATENKFGLKYWAGNQEEHTHSYFAGLEDRTKKQGVQTYTKQGLEKLLARAGYVQVQFYYPYPDYRFAVDIYSDQYLPKKGDLTYNIVNYEDDRIVVFDEQKVFDSIIEEGQFPLFANAFLCLARTNQAVDVTDMRKSQRSMIYTRYASDRAREHAVRTDIVCTPHTPPNASAAPIYVKAQEQSVRKVYKRPLYPQGAAHMIQMEKAYQQLCNQYGREGLQFNRCRLSEDQTDGGIVAEFDYLCAQALQAQVRQEIAAHAMEEVFGILDKIIKLIRSSRQSQPFAVTDQFTQVFGHGLETDILNGSPCSAVSDIDLILSNILVDTDGCWHVIDYEWTFFFPIPQNFIIYRTLFFLNLENPQCAELAMDKLLSFAGITQAEAQVYAGMERGFQNYVAGGLVPYREMVNLIGRKYLNIVQLKHDYDQLLLQYERLKGRGIWKLAGKIKRRVSAFGKHAKETGR